jgi:hypothetical protein
LVLNFKNMSLRKAKPNEKGHIVSNVYLNKGDVLIFYLNFIDKYKAFEPIE